VEYSVDILSDSYHVFTSPLNLPSLIFHRYTYFSSANQALLPTIRSLLSAVGNVLSASSETATGISNSAESGASQPKPQTSSSSNGGQLQLLEDLTAECQVEASSRGQLLACLLDGSCETFWESGPEDRGRERRLVLSWAGADLKLKLAALFVDNASDVGFRVNRVLAMGGPAKRQLMDTQVEKVGKKNMKWSQRIYFCARTLSAG